MAEETIKEPKRLTRSKRLSIYVLDGLLCGVFATILGFVGSYVLTATPIHKAIVSELVNSQNNMTSLIVASHLNEKNSSGELYTLNELSDSFLLSFTKASLLYNGKQESELSTIYQNVKAASPTNDRLYQYYGDFKIINEQDYSPLGNVGADYYIQELTKDHSDYFTQEGYVYFTLEAAEAVDESYRDSSYQKGAEIKENVKARTVDLLSKASNDLSSNYTPYVEANKAYQLAYASFVRARAIVGFIAGALACLLYFLLIPLALKGGRSLGMKANRAEYQSRSGEKIKRKQLAIRMLFHLIGIPFYAGFAVLLMPNSGASALLYPCFGPFALWAFSLFSLSFCLLSYAFSFFGQKQTLSERASSLFMVECSDEENGK